MVPMLSCNSSKYFAHKDACQLSWWCFFESKRLSLVSACIGIVCVWPRWKVRTAFDYFSGQRPILCSWQCTANVKCSCKGRFCCVVHAAARMFWITIERCHVTNVLAAARTIPEWDCIQLFNDCCCWCIGVVWLLVWLFLVHNGACVVVRVYSHALFCWYNMRSITTSIKKLFCACSGYEFSRIFFVECIGYGMGNYWLRVLLTAFFHHILYHV